MTLAAVERPVLPLRDLVFFPAMILPLLVGRPRSLAALEEAREGSGELLLLTQRHPESDDPEAEGLASVGTVARVLESTPLPDGTWKVVLQGLYRARAETLLRPEGSRPLQARVVPFPYPAPAEAERYLLSALSRQVGRGAQEYGALHPDLPSELPGFSASGEEAPEPLLNRVLGHLLVPPAEKQALLELEGLAPALEALATLLERELEVLRIEARLERDLSRRDDLEIPTLLREMEGEWAELESRLASAPLPPHARARAERELARLVRLNPASPEAGVIRGYLDWILDLPWEAPSQGRADLARAAEILEGAHHGLDEVKDRILDYISVLSLVGELKGPILCLVGPPGVGKTSFARSMARALERPFVRVSLGGVRDEAEIRGHRRTYVGSLPGRILQGMRRAGASDPVFLLDEVDKLTSDALGDPAAALLEVLDPEQNRAFQDHYLELDYDLSQVLFLATANALAEIPEALRDRMEVIRIPGYLETEKRLIAQRFLLPSQLERHGLHAAAATLDEAAMGLLLQGYTREAGVRELDRALARLARKLAREVAEGRRPLETEEHLTPTRIQALLGPSGLIRGGGDSAADRVGIATGLAWTSSGGEILEVEVATLPGSGQIQLTGTLGDVMKESAVAALTYARARAPQLGLRPLFHRDVDVHVHIPEGATPKDGPSAGVTMAVALLSALTGRPTRGGVAMTGELTLRGRVLPVGGIREKTVAALRHGLHTVLIPVGNAGEIERLPAEVRAGLTLIPVASMDDVLDQALLPSSEVELPSPSPFLGGSH